jgi:hypothetical protein
MKIDKEFVHKDYITFKLSTRIGTRVWRLHFEAGEPKKYLSFVIQDLPSSRLSGTEKTKSEILFFVFADKIKITMDVSFGHEQTLFKSILQDLKGGGR